LTSNTTRQKTIFRLVLLTSAGILALVFYQSLGYLLDPHRIPPKADAFGPQAGALLKPKPKNTATYKHIGHWHLFGMAPKEKDLSGTRAIDAPETSLNLTLLGVLFYPSQEESRAIIAEQGKPHKSYKVGDPLPRKATLHSIEAGRVILSRNGRHESLKLKKLELPEGWSDNGFNNQRLESPDHQTTDNLRGNSEEQARKPHSADQGAGSKKPKSAISKSPTPPSESKILQAAGRPQDV
jgi:hypothetical protein